jgi:hypothetical protein
MNVFIPLALAAALLASPTPPASAGEPVAGSTTTTPVVVELFTSQGCSSCPPADAFLGELAARNDVLALSMHVDYWDYIGWKDPFASPVMTARQRGYAATVGRGNVYTPEMVVDGTTDVVGSYRDQVLSAIDGARAHPKLALTFMREGSALSVTLPQTQLQEPATVWLAIYDGVHMTKVGRGENGGRQLTDYNVVRDFRALGPWDGSAATLPIDLGPQGGSHDGCAVIVQQGETGRILGAAALDLKALGS